MEAIKGGNLSILPEKAMEIVGEENIDTSPSALALKWVLDQDITLTLSVMSNEEQLVENIKTVSAAEKEPLTSKERKAVEKIKAFLDSKIKVGCTSCEYCMPCPFGVAIPSVFESYNNAAVFDNTEKMKKSYEKLIEYNKDASLCQESGACEEVCPQKLEIIEKLKEADACLR